MSKEDTMTATEKLKSCPFCGGPPRTLEYNGTTQATCAGDHNCAGTDVLAPVACWNTRPSVVEPVSWRWRQLHYVVEGPITGWAYSEEDPLLATAYRWEVQPLYTRPSVVPAGLAELSAKATQGPWRADDEALVTVDPVEVAYERSFIADVRYFTIPKADANAAFIVAAVNYVRSLLASQEG
jgi:hypothetical protein